MRAYFGVAAFAMAVLPFPQAANAQANLCTVSNEADWQRSVVMAGADKTIFKLPGIDFSFSRTIRTILSTAKLDSSEAAQRAAVQSLIDTFALDHAAHPSDNRKVSFAARSEANLKAANLLNESDPDGMHPIGLFNRFDQAPGDWKYCGEHRIVYAQGKTDTNRTGTLNRFFLIFEAAVHNPRPDLGAEGCRPIADLWKGLTRPGLPIGDIAKQLEKFYFVGLDGSDPSRSIQPVLHVEHFGNPFGQVRGNIFKQVPWQLRQWRVDPVTGAFLIVPIGTNPEPVFYSPPAQPVDSVNAVLRKDYQDLFVNTLVSQLAKPHESLVREEDLINHIGLLSDQIPKFNDFISNSQTPFGARDDDPTTVATTTGAFIDAIKAKLKQQSLADPQSVQPSTEEVLNRFGTTSCGGCHQFSVGKVIGHLKNGNEIKWPASADFVQIREDSALSPLLTKFFLPDRCEFLNSTFFVGPVAESGPAAVQIPSATKTLSEFSAQLKSLPTAARIAGQKMSGAFIDLERHSDRALLGASGRIRQSD